MKRLFKLLDGLNCLAHQAGVPADAGAGGTEPHASTPSVLDGTAAPAQSSATPAEGAADPAQSSAAPAEGAATPAQSSAAPAQPTANTTILDTTGQPGAAGPADDKTAGKDVNKAAPEALADIKGADGLEYAEGEIDELKALCTENKISPQAAQAILDWQAKFAKVADDKRTQAVQEEMAEFVRKEAEKNLKIVHQEWGTDPAQVAENEAAVARAMRAFADEGFRKLMNESGLGNHPDVVRFVVKAGKAITDDRFIVGGNGGAAKKDLAHRMFPNAK